MPALYDRKQRRHILLERSPLRIGRHADNDLVLLGREISRQHCELRKDLFGNWFIKQLGSRDAEQQAYNLTFVKRSDKIIEIRPGRKGLRLQDADEIAVGIKRQDSEPDFRFKYVIA